MQAPSEQKESASSAAGRSWLSEFRRTFRSLRHRNFRLYFFGQMVSLTGTWMQSLALSWLVYKLTKSAFLLGVVEFANLSPTLFLGLFAGSIADRFDRRKILLATQSLAMLQAIVLFGLTLSGRIEVWHILALSAFNGLVFAFEIPSRQALIVNMVDREDFINAISLNSSLFNGTRVIAPAAAALLVRHYGEAVCFGINAVSYLAAVTAVFMLRVPHEIDASKRNNSIQEGLRYAFKTPEIRSVMRITAFLSLFGAQFTLLLPIVAKEILHHDIEGFGALRSAAAIGSVSAALCLANRGAGPMLQRALGYAALIFGVMFCGFGVSHDFALTILFTLCLGFCMTFQLSASHSFLQLRVPDELRGRLMSVWTMMIMGLSPLGSLAIGWSAGHFGVPVTVMVSSIVVVISALIYLLMKA